MFVEDEADLVTMATTYLRRDGFQVVPAMDARTAVATLREHPADLMVLDLGLPDGNGLNLLREVRAGRHLPVIILTGWSSERDRVVGLELGADDYVVKPFSLPELAARIRAVLRRSRAPKADAVIRHGALAVDTDSHEVTANGQLIELPPAGVQAAGPPRHRATPGVHPRPTPGRGVGLGERAPGPVGGRRTHLPAAPQAHRCRGGPAAHRHRARRRLPAGPMTGVYAGLDYRRLFQHLPSPYLLMTADFTIVTVNNAYARATMIDPDAVAGRPMFEVFPDNPDDPNADGVGNLRRSLQTVVDTGRPDTMALQRYDIRAPDGGFVVRYWSPVNSPILDDAGRVMLIVHRVQDVTELINLREQDRERTAAQLQQMEADLYTRAREVQEANQQLREANAALAAATEELRAQQRAKDHFIATLSHELRNPLASASAALDVLGLDIAGHQAHQVLQRQLTALSRLTDDLLDAARVTTGNLHATRYPLDLRALVHAAMDDLPTHLARPAVTLPDEPVMIDGDPVRLGQMLTNLLDNARKHSEDNAVVTVELAVHNGRAVLRVRDTGPGFDPVLADTLFDPFTRVDTGTRTPSGLGLGLAIVRGIVELHQGEVRAHSAGPGTGATFTVRIPLTTKAVPPTADRPVHQALRMLLVDDNTDLAEMYAIMLRRRGDTVTVATTAHDALAIAESTPFDVILCDLALGEDIDGYEIARRLRQDTLHRHTLLVAVSGFNQDTDLRRSHAAGFDAHFAKPLDLADFDALLARDGGGTRALPTEPQPRR